MPDQDRRVPAAVDPRPVDVVRDAMRAQLRPAMRERDRDVVAALRVGIAALDNAEAVPSAPQPTDHGHVPDVARRELGRDEVVALLDAEVAEARRALAEVGGLSDDARRRLETTVRVLSDHAGTARTTG